MTKPRHITVITPVCAPPRVLREFLKSLAELESREIRTDYIFVDDNQNDESSGILADWSTHHPVRLLPAPPRQEPYTCDERTHHWNRTLIQRVADHKDRAIRVALEGACDAVFLVDADLVLDPATFDVLADADVDVVAEVFWTYAMDEAIERPNVWVSDGYSMVPAAGAGWTDAEREKASGDFLARLLTPGLHEVGGLGACTLVTRKVLEAGVRFAALPNISLLGEDRHFCIRAAAHGFRLWADTHAPPIHLYREEDFAKLSVPQFPRRSTFERWKSLRAVRRHALDQSVQAFDDVTSLLTGEDRYSLKRIASEQGGVSVQMRANLVRGMLRHSDDSATAVVELELSAEPCWRAALQVPVRLGPDALPRPQIILPRRKHSLLLTMVVRNERDRFLQQVLEHILPAVDDVVVIDDASDDGTPEFVHRILGKVPNDIIRLERSLFAQESELRAVQWRAVMARRPEWVLNLDADELFDEGAPRLLREHLDVAEDLVAFRLFDMWDRLHFRSDALWNAHQRWWPFLARPNPRVVARHPVKAQHCPRWPLDVMSEPAFASPLRIQHLGWSSESDRREKYERYLRLDPDLRWGNPDHVKSILDSRPNLEPWIPVGSLDAAHP